MSQNHKIRLFRDGTFVGTRSASTIEALYARDLVTLERNRKGYVVAAHERHVAAETRNETPRPIDPTASVLRPTRYSFEDARTEGRPWDLKRLNGRRSGISYAPAELRPIFCRVLLDCLA